MKLSKWNKTNKLLTFGIFVALFFLLLEFLILYNEKKTTIFVSNESKKANYIGIETIIEASNISSDKIPEIPELSENLQKRFSKNPIYPYPDGRNIFLKKEIPVIEKIIVKQPVKTKTVEKPNITYHGYYFVESEKVALLKKSSEILLVKVGAKIKDTSFKITHITSDKIIIKDYTNNSPSLEIPLSKEN